MGTSGRNQARPEKEMKVGGQKVGIPHPTKARTDAMKNNKKKTAGSATAVPPYWKSSVDNRGDMTLTNAIRGGRA